MSESDTTFPKKDRDKFVGNMGHKMILEDGHFFLEEGEGRAATYNPSQVLPSERYGRATAALRRAAIPRTQKTALRRAAIPRTQKT